MNRLASFILAVVFIMCIITVSVGAESQIIVKDSPVFIGVWRETGDLTGNITETGSSVLRAVLDRGEIALKRSDVINVDLPSGAYTFADSDDAVITIKESYLKERDNGYNSFTVGFNGIQIEVTYFIVKDKTVGDYDFNVLPNPEGNVTVTLTGIPATAPCLLSEVKLDGEGFEYAGKVRLTNWCNVITVMIDKAAVLRDNKPHVYSLTFENLDLVNITVYPGQMGDVNGDSNINAEDARLALRASAGLERLSDAAFVAADIDNNGKLTAAEARLILRAGAQLESL